MCGNFFFDKVKLSRSATSLKTRFLKTRYILVNFAKLNYGTKTKRRYQFEPEV